MSVCLFYFCNLGLIILAMDARVMIHRHTIRMTTCEQFFPTFSKPCRMNRHSVMHIDTLKSTGTVECLITILHIRMDPFCAHIFAPGIPNFMRHCFPCNPLRHNFIHLYAQMICYSIQRSLMFTRKPLHLLIQLAKLWIREGRKSIFYP